MGRTTNSRPCSLEDQIHYLTSIVDALADPVFVKDEGHRWVMLNDAYCRFMGYDREALLGKSDFDFFPRAEAQVFWAKDEAVIRTGVDNVPDHRPRPHPTRVSGRLRPGLDDRRQFGFLS